MTPLEELEVEQALEAAYTAGWDNALYTARNAGQAPWGHSRPPALSEEGRRQFLQVINAVGQSIQANSQGLTALAQTLDNWRLPS